MRFTKPSFRTKNASQVVISPSGKYLAQFGPRIAVYDIERRELIAEHKVIKNDHYIGFSEDETLMFSKNNNGEIVFFRRDDGTQVSCTGPFRRYGEGSLPQFSTDGQLLFDPTWQDELKVWDTHAAQCSGTYRFDGSSLTGLAKLQPPGRFAFASSSRHPNVGHSRLFLFDEGFDPLQFSEIKPVSPNLRNEDTWHRIDTFALCGHGSKLFLSVRPKLQSAMLVCIDVETGQEAFIELRPTNVVTTSLASNGEVLAAVSHTYPETRLSHAEWLEWKSNNETEHLMLVDVRNMRLISKIHWAQAQSVSFHPNGKGLAIAGRSKSGFIHDYQSLL